VFIYESHQSAGVN